MTLIDYNTNVKSKSMKDWYNARQRPNRIIRAYAAYLDEAATNPDNSPIDADRLQKLRSSLRDSIRTVIQAQVVQPTKRFNFFSPLLFARNNPWIHDFPYHSKTKDVLSCVARALRGISATQFVSKEDRRYAA